MTDQSKNMTRFEPPESLILSLHPAIEGNSFYWERGLWSRELVEQISKARAVILSQTVDKELYTLCRELCANVFPNYDLRFQWEGKVGDTLFFWTNGVSHPRSLVFPRVETLLGEHPFMDHSPPKLPDFPFVLKGARGGEGRHIWLIENADDLEKKLLHLKQLELHGNFGFVIQEYLAGLDRDLRVVVIGDQVVSYWRKSEGFLHNVAQGGAIDKESYPELQIIGRDAVMNFCHQTGINLAGFDLVFPSNSKEPVFLEINYTFGRSGLGGTDGFYKMLRQAVDRWLANK
jgi:ribosomal protein S6--L-glutamate ligase